MLQLAGCTCSSVDDRQYSCSCPSPIDQCLLMRGPPKIYLDPPPDYQVEPGGSLNISCAAVAYPFPQIFWEKGTAEAQTTNGANGGGAVKSEQVLIIKEVRGWTNGGESFVPGEQPRGLFVLFAYFRSIRVPSSRAMRATNWVR